MTLKITDQSRRPPLLRALRRRRSLRAGLAQLLYVCAGVAAGLLVPTLDVGPRMPTSEAASLMAGITAGLLAMIPAINEAASLVGIRGPTSSVGTGCPQRHPRTRTAAAPDPRAATAGGAGPVRAADAGRAVILQGHCCALANAVTVCYRRPRAR